MSSPFQKLAQSEYAENPKSGQKNPYQSPFEQIADSPENKESFWKSALRTTLQPIQGIAEGTGAGLFAGFSQLLGMGDVFDPEEIERIRAISEREGVPFDEEKYKETAQLALEYFPTVSNIGRELEKETGIPFEPKGFWQNVLRFGGLAGKILPVKGIAQKAVVGTASGLAKEKLKEEGVPEPLAELFALSFSPIAASESLYKGKGLPSFGKSEKPSGLTERRFEKLEKPTKVSESKIKKINETLENEFRDIASDIIEKSPIHKTYSALKEDTGFKQASSDAFVRVKELANEIPWKFSTSEIKKNMVTKILNQKEKGFTPSEYELAHRKFINQAIKDTPEKSIKAKEIVEQYRKNNETFGELREPGQSSAYNRGKKQALLDYNKVLAEMIEEKFPESEFSNLFKSSNKQWQEIMDVEAIDAFMNDLFEGKIQFKEGKNFIEKEGMQFPFKRALGEEGFNNFKQLVSDLMTTEKAHSLMKAAQAKGYKGLASTSISYFIHPKLGFVKSAFDIGKLGYRKIWEALLDKPQLIVKWDNGLKAFKKGDFKTAEREFKALEAEMEEKKNINLQNK